MRKIVVFLLCLMLIATPALAERKTSVTGLFTFECPDDCLQITGEFIDELLNGDMTEEIQSEMGNIGFDPDALSDLFEQMRSVDLSSLDFIYSSDFTGNVNMYAQVGLGLTPDMLPLIVSALDEQMVSLYMSMGVPEDGINLMGIQEIGGNSFYTTYIEMTGGLSMHQYMAFNEAGDQIVFTFTGFPQEDELALMESVEIL